MHGKCKLELRRYQNIVRLCI